MLIVQKFGGSSLADIERLRRAAGICLEARRREHKLIVVVSASGDVTDELVEAARQIDPRPPLRELDALMATGEQQSAALMAIMLRSMALRPYPSPAGRPAYSPENNMERPLSASLCPGGSKRRWMRARSPLWRAFRGCPRWAM